jgi:hypothetical protein
MNGKIDAHLVFRAPRLTGPWCAGVQTQSLNAGSVYGSGQ